MLVRCSGATLALKRNTSPKMCRLKRVVSCHSFFMPFFENGRYEKDQTTCLFFIVRPARNMRNTPYAFKLGINQSVNKCVHAFTVRLCRRLYSFLISFRYCQIDTIVMCTDIFIYALLLTFTHSHITHLFQYNKCNYIIAHFSICVNRLFAQKSNALFA